MLWCRLAQNVPIKLWYGKTCPQRQISQSGINIFWDFYCAQLVSRTCLCRRSFTLLEWIFTLVYGQIPPKLKTFSSKHCCPYSLAWLWTSSSIIFIVKMNACVIGWGGSHKIKMLYLIYWVTYFHLFSGQPWHFRWVTLCFDSDTPNFQPKTLILVCL